MDSFKPTTIRTALNHGLTFPGISQESTTLVEQLLLEIHQKYDIFVNEQKFHNHSVHHLLASFSLGASPKQLQEIYDTVIPNLRAIPPSTSKITRENYKTYLNQADAYTSFLEFFNSEIKDYGVNETVRRWIWSDDILTRTISGLFHPLIHIGYGLEFNLPGIVSQGLAMAVCTEDVLKPLTPMQPSLVKGDLTPLHQLFNQEYKIDHQLIANLSINERRKKEEEPNADLTNRKEKDLSAPYSFLKENPLVQTIISIQNDTGLDLAKPNVEAMERIQGVIGDLKNLAKIRKYLDTWEVKATPQSIRENYRLLYECILILYSTAAFGPKDGSKKDRHYKLDFFLMHALTSAYFIQYYLEIVTPSEAASLLHEHWASTVVYYIAEGRPYLNVEKALAYHQVDDNNNGWFQVFEKALGCKEEHVIKSVRSLAYGQTSFGPTECEHLNSLWLKAAQMTVEKDGDWDLSGLGLVSTWNE